MGEKRSNASASMARTAKLRAKLHRVFLLIADKNQTGQLLEPSRFHVATLPGIG